MRKRTILLGFAAGLAAAQLVGWSRKPTWDIEHETRIEASGEEVWRLVSNFDGYAAWNSYTPSVSGEVKEGAIVRSRGHLGDLKFDVKNLVTLVIPGERFCWRSLDWYGPAVHGTRCRVVERRGDATVFHHHEHFEGPMAWLVAALVGDRIEQGIRTHDADLKRAAEEDRRRVERVN